MKKIKKLSNKIIRLASCNKLCKPKPTVAVIRLAGIIGEAGSFKRGLTLEELDDDIKKAFEIPNLKAVAVQINSPGGSPVQSELIYNAIRYHADKKKIPVYSFAEDLAASGGYWLLCAGDEIYAHESSLIGSIGVISAGFGFVEAIKKLGIERRVYTQGENKSVLDPFQLEKQSDIEILKEAQKDVHEAFKAHVKSRRKIKKSDEERLFSGEFWSGKKAKSLGLVDDIGDLRSVLVKKFGDDVKIEKISKPKGWLKRKFGVISDVFFDSLARAISEKAIWSKFGM